MNTRRTQPYRRGARQAGPALTAMTRGRTAGGYHPLDALRTAMKRRRRARPTGRRLY